MEQAYKTHSDGMRQLLELAICCGRGWQSAQTGFIHYSYHLQDETHHDSIPFYENFLFILALMRSRIAENITDAKKMLEQLLHFQTADGHFPIYLHEYPVVKDMYWSAHLLPPLFWIYKNFHHVLGSDLKQALKKALMSLMTACLQMIQEKKVPYSIYLKVAACASSLGPLIDQESMAETGTRLFNESLKNQDKVYWSSPSLLSELIIALQMVNPELIETPLKGFWEYLLGSWHADLSAYCGPCWKQYQYEKEPQVTFYDFFMGYLTGTFSRRCFRDHPIQLQAALIHPVEAKVPFMDESVSQEGMVNGLPWKLMKTRQIGLSLLAKESLVIPVQEKAFSALQILWGGPQRLHSFVCQGGACQQINYQLFPDHVDLFFTFSELPEADHAEKNQEICFYFDEEVGIKATVDNTPATTFRMENAITIFDDSLKLNLSFHLQSGSGDFIGHLMKSNRPSQQANVGANRFTAYDWQIFLRTLTRSEECVIKATLTWSF